MEIGRIFPIFQLIKDISKTVKDYVEGDLLNKLKKIGNIIFNLYYFGGPNYNGQCINDIRTPALFLGNVLSGDENWAKDMIVTYDDMGYRIDEEGEEALNRIVQLDGIKDEEGFKAAISIFVNR